MQKPNEVVVISGKGGTGKTSVVASAIPYINDLIIVDCDVDAPDLNILFGETVKESTVFIGLKKAHIDINRCNECGDCIDYCKFNAISDDFVVDSFRCEGCGVCNLVCNNDAVLMKDTIVGHILTSDTIYGEMVHGKLIPGEEASGKLVSQVRKIAKDKAEKQGLLNIIVDGSPGIACNVISSITGAKRVVIVIEPTMSGMHDLKRVYELTQKIRTKASVVINKWDLSVGMTREIEEYCRVENILIDIRIPFNKVMVDSISNREIPSVYAKDFFEKLNFKKVVERWFE